MVPARMIGPEWICMGGGVTSGRVASASVLTPDTLGRGPFRPIRVALGSRAPLAEVLRRLSGRPGVVCLTGRWADDSTVLTADPLVVRHDLSVLEGQSDPSAGAADAVGGGWFGFVGFG